MRCATCKAPTADEITPHLYYGFLIKPQTGHTVIFGSAEPEIPEALRVQVGNQYAFMWRKGQLPNNQTPHVLNVSVAPAATTSALLSNYASEFPVGEAGAWVESGVSETAVYETVQRTLYPFAGQAVAVRETIGTAETLTYLYNDHLGSAAIMTDDAGVVVDGSVTKYYPFGSYRERPTTNPTTTTLGFTGHRHDDGAGLIYANARYYLPQIGRFASADILVPEPANPQSFNRYSYVYNRSPIMRDPDGRTPRQVPCILSADDCVPVPSMWRPLRARSSRSGSSQLLATWRLLQRKPRLLFGNFFGQDYPPKSPYSVENCVSSLTDCFATDSIKDLAQHGPEDPIPATEFFNLMDAVVLDLYTYHTPSPGWNAGRGVYDSPFYNGGGRGSANPDGTYPSSQEVCIETFGCHERSNVNYFPQGMWSAASGESLVDALFIANAWKLTS